MDWQPETGSGAGASPGRDPGVPGGAPPVRDPRLAGFARACEAGEPVPSGRLALLADEVSGPERRCPGATDDELIGLLRAWTAMESWSAAAKLGVIRELIRREDAPPGGGYHGDLPDGWSQSLRYELASALACSTQTAETTAWLAWEQQARVPGIGALLEDGTLTPAKARAVVETFRFLMDDDAAKAEALILDLLAGKTYPQVLRLAEWAALTVDPEVAERQREHAQKKNARVSFFREQSGAAALSGRDLPPDETLAAMASVNARAQEYKTSDEFGDTGMDVLRAYAYLDLLNGVSAETRIAYAEVQDETADAAADLAWAQARAGARTAAEARTRQDGGEGPGPGGSDRAQDEPGPREPDAGCPSGPVEAGENDGDGRDGDGGPDDGGPDDGGPDDGGPDDGGPDDGGPGGSPSGLVCPWRPADLIVPLATLLGLAERPGEIHGFGLLDPALARELAAAAAATAGTEVCVTVTSPEGYAVGHGCGRPDLASRRTPGPGIASLAGFPARLNLTIPATELAGVIARLARNPGPWAFTPRGSPGPPDGCGDWTLTLPAGRRYVVRLEPVPTFECDHRYESQGYQPGDKLRHLVQVRDGTCTFPPCSRHARESDFEHAVPYDKGGKTCTCNAGARSRACHRVKQSPGWTVTQPKPGWHQWQTPAGRVYTQEPKRYPA